MVTDLSKLAVWVDEKTGKVHITIGTYDIKKTERDHDNGEVHITTRQVDAHLVVDLCKVDEYIHRAGWNKGGKTKVWQGAVELRAPQEGDDTTVTVPMGTIIHDEKHYIS